MHKSPRSPALYYVYFLLTGGLFVFAWTYLLMVDTNRACKDRIFPAEMICLASSALFIFGIGLVLLSISGGQPPHFEMILLILTPLLFAELIVVFAIPVAVNKFISRAEGKRPEVSDSLSIVLRMLAFGLGLPFLQKRLNNLSHNRLASRVSTAAFYE